MFQNRSKILKNFNDMSKRKLESLCGSSIPSVKKYFATIKVKKSQQQQQQSSTNIFEKALHKQINKSSSIGDKANDDENFEIAELGNNTSATTIEVNDSGDNCTNIICQEKVKCFIKILNF